MLVSFKRLPSILKFFTMPLLSTPTRYITSYLALAGVKMVRKLSDTGN